jgi:hypothetical protein
MDRVPKYTEIYVHSENKRDAAKLLEDAPKFRCVPEIIGKSQNWMEWQ